jgi:hypothetical protein
LCFAAQGFCGMAHSTASKKSKKMTQAPTPRKR